MSAFKIAKKREGRAISSGVRSIIRSSWTATALISSCMVSWSCLVLESDPSEARSCQESYSTEQIKSHVMLNWPWYKVCLIYIYFSVENQLPSYFTHWENTDLLCNEVVIGHIESHLYSISNCSSVLGDQFFKIQTTLATDFDYTDPPAVS